MSTSTKQSPVHPVNVTQLVLGLVFLGVAGTWALVASDTLGTDQLGWVLPLMLVVAGAVGLVAVVAKGMTSGGARRLDGPDGPETHDDRADVQDTEVHDLEATAYAPYASDLDRTRVLQAEERSRAGQQQERGEQQD